MNKNDKKDLHKIASMLPTSYYEAKDKLFATGKQLMNEGVTEFEGKPINEKETYWFTETKLYPVNHYRQLKRIYELQGKQGIIAYIKAQAELHRPAPLPQIPQFRI